MLAVVVGALVVTAAPAGAAMSGHAVFATARGVASMRLVPALGSGNLAYHGGKVMKKNLTYAIFWQPATLQNGKATTVSATYDSLLTRYLQDIGGSGLENSTTQYYQVVNGAKQPITNSSAFQGSWVDTSPYPASGCSDSATPGNCLTDAQLQAEVKRALTANGWTAGTTKMFFVFTSKGEGSCYDPTACAFAYYCAYHSSFTSGGHRVIYANMPYTGTSPAACGAGVSPNNDPDADSTINVTSHEHMEAITDPNGNAWYDAAGYENGDKCAWTFGSMPYANGTANQSLHGHYYVMQQEWSNAASRCVSTYP